MSGGRFTLGSNAMFSVKDGVPTILQVKDLNKLPPMVNNFRGALIEVGHFFIQKHDSTTNKIKNFLKQRNFKLKKIYNKGYIGDLWQADFLFERIERQ